MLKKIPTFKINYEKNILGGRPTGDKVREQVIAQIKSNPLDSMMRLDFGEVLFLDYSCADEFICKLIRRIMIRDFGERYVLISGVNDLVKENLEAALKERKLVVPGVDANNQTILYGDISQEMRETYNFAVEKETFTARDIAESGLVSDNKINSASNRITKLFDMALVRKVNQENVGGGGRQFVYEAVK
ncbi:MAG: hypothetical protein KKH94_09600 [Candidatus Omnitrophica bacterium]|nr:hypothetical protein [Candidatus Omnitrophota bacterium]